MSKKVLILSSSPRRNGNSDLLCNEFMRGAAEAGHQVEKIFLKDKHINYCTGCSVCSMYGKPCPQKDDAAEVVEKMIAADVIVMATPVYFYTMSAQMKTLIDRCCARYLEIKDKEFYFIIAAAEESVPHDGAYHRWFPWLPRLPGRAQRMRHHLWRGCLEGGRDKRQAFHARSLRDGKKGIKNEY